jgi:hypothetical protein
MSNHRARTWDHRGSKPLGPKLLPLDHHLDGFDFFNIAPLSGDNYADRKEKILLKCSNHSFETQPGPTRPAGPGLESGRVDEKIG